MDSFTQRMLERARARQEKIDQKLANSGQIVPKRKPLSENTIGLSKATVPSTVKSPVKALKAQEPVKSPSRRSSLKNDQKLVNKTPQRHDVVVTKKEFNSPKRSNSSRKSDVSVEINIMHREDIQIEVQVEEREVPLTVYDAPHKSSFQIKEIEDSKEIVDKKYENMESEEPKSGLRKNVKSRLDRLGVLYSDKADLSSPIHRTEEDFTSATPPSAYKPKEPTKTEPRKGAKKFGRLAALADEINNWEDDLSHHNFHPEPEKKTNKSSNKKPDDSVLDVSIHSYQDINKVISKPTDSNKKANTKAVNSRTFSRKSPAKNQLLDNNIVAELEGEGYRRVSAGQSRLVYDFSSSKKADHDRQEPKGASSSPRRTSVNKMATLVASSPQVKPTVAKKPSIKKYKAPTPPKLPSEGEKDKENNVLQREENDNTATDDCVQTKPEPAQDVTEQVIGKGSPVVKRLAPKLNGNVDRNSVLSKAAMFEAGSPKKKDPAEMSLRERKALFEKNKGSAIVPKAPFGLAPSVKSLHGDNKDTKPVKPLTSASNLKTTPTKSISSINSKEDTGDNISQTSVGGIRGKLVALFSRENSESNLGSKYRQEREKEMEMLHSRYQYNKNITLTKQRPTQQESDDEGDPSESAPLMGSTLSLGVANKKPEIIGNIPKVTFDDSKTKSETALHDKEKHKDDDDDDHIVGSQPIKRRSSQDSPAVLAVLEDVKRIRVNANKTQNNTAIVQQPASIYPHLSDIETDTSNTQEENSDCGSSETQEDQDKFNKSENWADTSFGREVLKVVKNNSSYTKAINNESDSSSNIDSDLDNLLDEALNEDDSEGPTPPKVHKTRNSLSSRSFTYKEGSAVKKQFKSPLKVPVTPAKTPGDKGSELVHSVSFYRRTQASSQPTTPIRVIRRESPNIETPKTEQDNTNVTTVRERIKQLQEEIKKQQTVISQASQALNLCAATVEFSSSTEQAEAERLLLLATHRRQACVHEVQRLQVEGAGEAARAGQASLKLTAITVPLRRDYVRKLHAEGAVGHHVVCILKCRDRVLATSMQQTRPDSHCPGLVFPDVVHMDGLTADFKVTMEIYLLQASKEFLPHDVKYHISNKKSSKLLTPKSKVRDLKTPAVQSPAGPLSVRSPQFQPHGYCIFALPQANRDSFTLSKLPCGSPLEGSIQVKISASIQAVPPAPHSAFLTAFDDVSGLGAWHRRWFVLHAHAHTLSYWKYPDDVNRKLPIGDIDLGSVVSERATRAPRELCARPNTILLESAIPAGVLLPDCGSLVYCVRHDGTTVRRHLLAADTNAERDAWIHALNDALHYVRCNAGQHQ